MRLKRPERHREQHCQRQYHRLQGVRAEFADVYANSIFVNAKTQVGNGVATGAVAQQFHQGALQFTNNALDLAIQGNGFFVTSDG
jgi:flagellar hook protein FlgE